MAVRDYSGNAKKTTLNGAVTNVATTLVVSDGTGYPTGAAGPFIVTLESGQSAEEKVLCTSRTGNSIVVSSRGFDGTTASAHANGVSVEHTISATDLREANAHVNDTTGDPHPQYLSATEGDSTYVNVAGDTMTGLLTLNAGAVSTRLRVTESSLAAGGEVTTGTAYAALTTATEVDFTVPPSERYTVTLSAEIVNNTTEFSFFGFEVFDVTGAALNLAADDNRALYQRGTSEMRASYSLFLFGGAGTAGRTFRVRARYRVSGGTGTFSRRHIFVTPSP